jgi:hypothetical protein
MTTSSRNRLEECIDYGTTTMVAKILDTENSENISGNKKEAKLKQKEAVLGDIRNLI